MSTIQWIHSHIHIYFDPDAIVISVERHLLPMVLRQLILARWAMYQLEPLRGTSYGWSTTPALLWSSSTFTYTSIAVTNRSGFVLF
jgi:hypothetical protein